MFPFLQVFAMTDTVTSSLGGLGGASTGSSDLPDFPGEHPSDKDLCDWLDLVMPKLRRLYGALLRGETPQHLLQFENGADDLTGLERIDPAATPEGMSVARVMQHNRQVDVETKAVVARRNQLAAGLRTERSNLAQLVIGMMQRKAPLRLKSLLATHAVAGYDECYKGDAMVKDLLALRGTTGQHEEVQDHDREVERMRDEPLPDGCSVDDYAYRVNELIRDHVDHLERPLQGAALGRFIVRMMPAVNASEGRSIIRRCTDAELTSVSGSMSERRPRAGGWLPRTERG